MFRHGFDRWPFEISSGAATDVRWAARAALKVDLERQLANVGPTRPTSLVNIWAAYGSGKTFAMRYLASKADATGIFSIYCVAPGAASGFSAYYRAIIDSLESQVFRVLAESLSERSGPISQSVYQASRFITIGNKVQAAEAQAYLAGAKVTQRKRNELNVASDLSEIGNASSALSVILSCLGASRGVLLLLDELQDLAEMKDKALGETVRCFQKVFDEVHHGLKIMTSFTAFSKDTVTQLLGPALASRSSRTLEIPEFDRPEAITFLTDLVLQAKNIDSKDVKPFSERLLQQCVDEELDAGGKLLPRPLILRANNMLEELDAG